MMKAIWRWFVVLALLAAPLSAAQANAFPQAETPETRARALLGRLSPAERVGQLFLVTFEGATITPESPIYDLILNYHIGGVVLRADNHNFAPPPETVEQLYQLTVALQELAWQSALQERTGDVTRPAQRTAYIPLWIGVQQVGGGQPYDEILSGLSPLPPPMALGATWDTDLARQSGQVAGRELSALGVNLLFGPRLDVLSVPNAARSGDPGISVFGGDPFWVGRLGQSYIDGLHTGSQQRLLVVPGRFPGLGMIDRDPQVEIPVLRRSLDQLQQVELAPFVAVTGQAPMENMQADGLLVSHIRYQGLQGNIRLATRPVSLDAASLAMLFEEASFAAWREAGGLIICDALDTQAIRKFYDLTGNTFNPALVARDAFLAGNDLIYLGNLQADGQTVAETVRGVLEYFEQKYQRDAVFAAQVDAAVLRVLTAKYRLYPTFVYNDVVPAPNGLRTIGDSKLIDQVARQAATLLSPTISALDEALGVGPGAREHIVFITEPQIWRQCPDCPAQVTLGRDDMERVTKQLYGSAAGGQIYSTQLHSYTFADLDALAAGQNADLEADLRRARWVVLAAADLRPTSETYRQMQALLAGRQDLLREKRVVLFHFGAPYALDATDISKLTAYYVLYAPLPSFIETAVRLLFQEFLPSGVLPVSVPAIGYDIAVAVSPDPDQLLTFSLEGPEETGTIADGETDSAIGQVPLLQLGDMVFLRTDPVVDHNGHIVPDGTVVTFSIVRRGEEGNILQHIQAETRAGVALASLRLEDSGLLEISATSEPAFTSIKMLLEVSASGPAQVVVVTPTILPLSPSPSPAVAIVARETEEEATDSSARWLRWWEVMFFLLLGSWGVYRLVGRRQDARRAAQQALGFVVGGLLALNGVLWGMAPAAWQRELMLGWAGSGAMLGWVLAVFWQKVSATRAPAG